MRVMQHADRGGNGVSASVTGSGCNALDPGSCKYRALVRLYRVHESEEDNGAITALHHGQFTRVTLIRGKTNDRGPPPRPPTEAETFLIISELMKPRAVRMILVLRALQKRERAREREEEERERERRECVVER